MEIDCRWHPMYSVARLSDTSHRKTPWNYLTLYYGERILEWFKGRISYFQQKSFEEMGMGIEWKNNSRNRWEIDNLDYVDDLCLSPPSGENVEDLEENSIFCRSICWRLLQIKRHGCGLSVNGRTNLWEKLHTSLGLQLSTSIMTDLCCRNVRYFALHSNS